MENKKESVLFWAARYNLTKLAVHLASKRDVNESNLGWVPLTWAAAHKNIKLAKALLKNGANPNFEDESGWGPLEVAKLNKDSEMESLLLSYC